MTAAATAIGDLEPRRRATMAGKIVSVVAYEWPWVRTDAEVGDGTRSVVLRFMGRAEVPGIVPGRRIVAEGTPAVSGNVLMVHNPLYQFVAD
jgi:hypothetical protein